MNKFKYSLKKAEHFDSYLQAGVSALYLTLVRPVSYGSLPGWMQISNPAFQNVNHLHSKALMKPCFKSLAISTLLFILHHLAIFSWTDFMFGLKLSMVATFGKSIGYPSASLITLFSIETSLIKLSNQILLSMDIKYFLSKHLLFKFLLVD